MRLSSATLQQRPMRFVSIWKTPSTISGLRLRKGVRRIVLLSSKEHKHTQRPREMALEQKSNRCTFGIAKHET